MPKNLQLEEKLPVHGLVLAGGKSSRMGVDKATLEFRGRPMVEIAVEKLRGFCADVSICGNRDDLAGYAPVVHEARLDCGPAAGIEAGLLAAKREWCLFVPVDVPLVPGEFLRKWVQDAIQVPFVVSTAAAWDIQPAFCLLRGDRLPILSRLLDEGVRKLGQLQRRLADADGNVMWTYDPYDFENSPGPMSLEKEARLEQQFANLNTPAELAAAELWVESLGE